ncbi:MAG TPA: TonB-dependent siderophore receptor [Burkholderiales bacterium]|nr:TonB-dependent siderophore receptor [Burkholderiales bacterium]
MKKKPVLRPIAAALAGLGTRHFAKQQAPGIGQREASRSGWLPVGAILTGMALAPMHSIAQETGTVAQASESTLPEVEVTSAAEQEGFRTESTSTATRTETPLRDIPQTVNLVPQSVIRSQGATSLVDALRNVPGIAYAAPEGGTQNNQLFYLRGFPSGGDLFIDGLRDLGEYNRDLFAIESVEVLKGPSALMFGRGSTGGVVNQVSKKPDLGTLKEAGITLGSNGEKRLTGDLNLQMGDTSAFRLNALVEDSDTFRDTVETKQVGVAPSLKFGIGTPTEVTLAYYYLHTEGQTDYGQPTLFTAGTGFFGIPPIDPKNYYGFANYDFTEWDTNIATLRLDHKFSDTLNVRNTTRWANYQREMEATIATLNDKDANGNTVTAGTPFDLLLANRIHNKARDNDDTVLINQTELTWKVETGAIKHTVLTGLELAKEDLDRVSYNFDADPLTAGVQAPAATTPLLSPDPFTGLSYTKTPNQNNVSDAKTIAVYVQDQLEFSPEWKALFGVRWERYDSSVQQIDIATGTITKGMDGIPIDFSRVDEMVSGRAGLIWQPSAAQSYYISAGNSYNPSGELGVYGATGTNLGTQTLANLDPEENRNYEIGAQWDLAMGLQVRAALFRTEKINARMNDPSGTVVLEGKRRVDGIELSAAGRLAPKWDVYGAMALMDGEIVEAADPVPPALPTEGNVPWGVPYASGSVWTIYRLGGGWEVGGGAFASSSWWLDDQNRGEAPGYVRWDATVAYVQKKYEVRLNVLNVTDTVYYVGGYQNTPNRVTPGQPLTGLISFNYRFD